MKLIEIDQEYLLKTIADIKNKLPPLKEAVVYSRHAITEDAQEVHQDASRALQQINDKLSELRYYLEDQ